MKTHLLALAIVGAVCSISRSQSPKEVALYEKLTNGPKSVEALETVLKAPEEYSALILYIAASEAFKKERLEDTGFLFYAGRLRARFDKECFPPKGTGGDSPFVLLSALSQQLGSAINPALMAKPLIFEKSIARVKAWTPKASPEYDPGYEFTMRKLEKDATEAVRANRNDFVDGMTGLAKLLNDADYFAAFRIVQAFNLGSDDIRPTEQESEKAKESMKQIEKDKKLKGIFSN